MGAQQDEHEKSQIHLKIIQTCFCQAIVVAWFCFCLMRVCGAACWGPELSTFFFCTEVEWCKHQISQRFCWYLQTMDAQNQHDSKLVVCDNHQEISWAKAQSIIITDDKPILRLQFQNCRPSMLLFSDVAIGCNRLNESNLVVLSWFGGVVGMKFSLKQSAPYLLSSGADFWFSTDFSFSRIYTCMNSIHIVANNITYPVTCLRGISLLLMCVALSVLFSMGYPIMMPHLAIASFSIHHLLCKLGNGHSWPCLFL